MQELVESYRPASISQELVNTTLGDMLREIARDVPDRLALVEGVKDPLARRRWTYAELLEQSERVARALLHTFKVGEAVGIYAPNAPEWVIYQQAISLAGLVLVPLNPAYTTREVAFVLGNCEAAGVIFAESYRGRDLRAVIEEVRAQVPNLRAAIPMRDIDRLLAQGATSEPLPKVKPTDIMQIQYTSGTTGFPKGACLHHYGVINTSRNISLRGNFPDGGVYINAMPMFHIAGDVVAEIGAMALRGTFVLMPEFDPGLMLELFESERGAATLIVPTMILAVLRHPDREKFNYASWKTIYSGAANVPAAMVRDAMAAFDCQFCIIFGQTESNGPITLTSPEDSIDDQCETVGRPLPHVEVKIVEPASEQILPTDTIGEIWVRGYQTMTGYYGMKEATAATLKPDGWLRTGDLGSMDKRGYLKITGRLKDMIIRGGMHLYPKEMEDVLYEHPGVADVTVLGVPDETWGEVVGAVIRPRDIDNPPLPEELFAYVRANLAAHKAPTMWYFVREYPMTSTGKIQKNQLIAWIKEKRIEPVAWTRPTRTVETDTRATG